MTTTQQTEDTARTALAVSAGETAPLQRLDPYGVHGIAAQAGRVAPLAIVSLGFRQPPRSDGALGLPRATRRDDTKWLHLHDTDGRAPGLKAALEEGNHRRLQIAFPTDSGFIQQSFTRWSASALEVYGDGTGLHLMANHEFIPAGSPEFERLVRTCKADTRIYFTLARWVRADDEGELPSSELSFPDGFGVYVFRTTGRHSAANIFGYLESISTFTRGRIAGIPFDLEVTFPEVVGPDGKKRTVPAAQIVMRPPASIRLNSRTFRHFAAAGLQEGRNLQLPALPAPDELMAEGPPELEDEIPEDALQRLGAGDYPCDYELTLRTWHAIVRGTPLESDEARADWLRGWSHDDFSSLTGVRGLTQREATQMLADLAGGVADVREDLAREERKRLAAEYQRVIGSHYDDEPAPKASYTQTASAQGNATRSAPSVTADGQMIKSVKHPLMQRLATLLEDAAQMDIDPTPFRVTLPAPQVEVESKVQQLGAEIADIRHAIANAPAAAEEAAQVSF